MAKVPELSSEAAMSTCKEWNGLFKELDHVTRFKEYVIMDIICCCYYYYCCCCCCCCL